MTGVSTPVARDVNDDKLEEIETAHNEAVADTMAGGEIIVTEKMDRQETLVSLSHPEQR